jgi:hypothetical protein
MTSASAGAGQYVFPSSRRSVDFKSGAELRHHCDPAELLDHSDVKTIMIYTHVLTMLQADVSARESTMSVQWRRNGLRHLGHLYLS